jgi:hypothetical protein
MSNVPAAIDGLVAVFTAELGTAKVVDGPPTRDVAGDMVAVGLDPQEPADVESIEAIAGLRVVHESFIVPCLARSWSGNDSVKNQRDRTYALIQAVKAVLVANPTLDRAVTRTRFAGSTYSPWRSESSQLVVDVRFRVAVDVL